MTLNDNVVYRSLRLGPLHQRHPGRSRSLVRHDDRFHRTSPCIVSEGQPSAFARDTFQCETPEDGATGTHNGIFASRAQRSDELQRIGTFLRRTLSNPPVVERRLAGVIRSSN
jgi:hypothetical protein